LLLFEEHNRKISKNRLYFLGAQKNFIKMANDGYHRFYYKKKIIEYLMNLNKPEEDYIPLAQLAKECGLSIGATYKKTRRWNVPKKTFNKILYVHRETYRRIKFNKRKGTLGCYKNSSSKTDKNQV
jgi:hypothetical protein